MDQTVLICPLGWERDRASLLAIDLRVHRVYLLYQPEYPDTKRYADAVAKDLKGKDTEVVRIELTGAVVTREFDWLLFNVARTIVDEHSKQNIIYVSMSASSKVAAAATTIAAMFHREKIKTLIYVVPSSYSIQAKDPAKSFREHGLGVGIARRYFLPLFHIERPADPILGTVISLYENGPMKYGKLLETLKAAKVPGFEGVKIPSMDEPQKRRLAISKWTARLRRNILDPVEGLYVETGRSHEGPEKLVRLTIEGQQLAILSGRVLSLR